MDLAALRTVAGLSAVLGDAQRHRLDFDLLHDTWGTSGRLQPLAALGAGCERIAARAAVELFREKRRALVAWVAGLAAATPLAGAAGRSGLGWLNEVGRGRLGGSGGVFASARQLFLGMRELRLRLLELLLQRLELGAQRVKLCL